jgi:hypothetical protein
MEPVILHEAHVRAADMSEKLDLVPFYIPTHGG